MAVGHIPKKDSDGNPIYAPTFEDDGGLTGAWQGYLYTATKNTLNIWDEPVTTELKLRGGWYQLCADSASPQAIKGDYLEFAIVDKTNVLGLHTLYGIPPYKHEIQTITMSATPTAGTWTITYDGQTTSALQFDASASDVETALNALSNLSGVIVSQAGLVYTVTFRGDNWQDWTDHAEMTSNDASLTGATISHATTQNGATGVIIELSKYVRNEWIVPYDTSRQQFIVNGAADVVQGLFFRTYYNSTGTVNDVDVKVMTYFHET